MDSENIVDALMREVNSRFGDWLDEQLRNEVYTNPAKFEDPYEFFTKDCPTIFGNMNKIQVKNPNVIVVQNEEFIENVDIFRNEHKSLKFEAFSPQKGVALLDNELLEIKSEKTPNDSPVFWEKVQNTNSPVILLPKIEKKSPPFTNLEELKRNLSCDEFLVTENVFSCEEKPILPLIKKENSCTFENLDIDLNLQINNTNKPELIKQEPNIDVISIIPIEKSKTSDKKIVKRAVSKNKPNLRRKQKSYNDLDKTVDKILQKNADSAVKIKTLVKGGPNKIQNIDFKNNSSPKNYVETKTSQKMAKGLPNSPRKAASTPKIPTSTVPVNKKILHKKTPPIILNTKKYDYTQQILNKNLSIGPAYQEKYLVKNIIPPSIKNTPLKMDTGPPKLEKNVLNMKNLSDKKNVLMLKNDAKNVGKSIFPDKSRFGLLSLDDKRIYREIWNIEMAQLDLKQKLVYKKPTKLTKIWDPVPYNENTYKDNLIEKMENVLNTLMKKRIMLNEKYSNCSTMLEQMRDILDNGNLFKYNFLLEKYHFLILLNNTKIENSKDTILNNVIIDLTDTNVIDLTQQNVKSSQKVLNPTISSPNFGKNIRLVPKTSNLPKVSKVNKVETAAPKQKEQSPNLKSTEYEKNLQKSSTLFAPSIESFVEKELKKLTEIEVVNHNNQTKKQSKILQKPDLEIKQIKRPIILRNYASDGAINNHNSVNKINKNQNLNTSKSQEFTKQSFGINLSPKKNNFSPYIQDNRNSNKVSINSYYNKGNLDILGEFESFLKEDQQKNTTKTVNKLSYNVLKDFEGFLKHNNEDLPKIDLPKTQKLGITTKNDCRTVMVEFLPISSNSNRRNTLHVIPKEVKPKFTIVPALKPFISPTEQMTCPRNIAIEDSQLKNQDFNNLTPKNDYSSSKTSNICSNIRESSKICEETYPLPSITQKNEDKPYSKAVWPKTMQNLHFIEENAHKTYSKTHISKTISEINRKKQEILVNMREIQQNHLQFEEKSFNIEENNVVNPNFGKTFENHPKVQKCLPKKPLQQIKSEIEEFLLLSPVKEDTHDIKVNSDYLDAKTDYVNAKTNYACAKFEEINAKTEETKAKSKVTPKTSKIPEDNIKIEDCNNITKSIIRQSEDNAKIEIKFDKNVLNSDYSQKFENWVLFNEKIASKIEDESNKLKNMSKNIPNAFKDESKPTNVTESKNNVNETKNNGNEHKNEDNKPKNLDNKPKYEDNKPKNEDLSSKTVNQSSINSNTIAEPEKQQPAAKKIDIKLEKLKIMTEEQKRKNEEWKKQIRESQLKIIKAEVSRQIIEEKLKTNRNSTAKKEDMFTKEEILAKEDILVKKVLTKEEKLAKEVLGKKILAKEDILVKEELAKEEILVKKVLPKEILAKEEILTEKEISAKEEIFTQEERLTKKEISAKKEILTKGEILTKKKVLAKEEILKIDDIKPKSDNNFQNYKTLDSKTEETSLQTKETLLKKEEKDKEKTQSAIEENPVPVSEEISLNNTNETPTNKNTNIIQHNSEETTLNLQTNEEQTKQNLEMLQKCVEDTILTLNPPKHDEPTSFLPQKEENIPPKKEDISSFDKTVFNNTFDTSNTLTASSLNTTLDSSVQNEEKTEISKEKPKIKGRKRQNMSDFGEIVEDVTVQYFLRRRKVMKLTTVTKRKKNQIKDLKNEENLQNLGNFQVKGEKISPNVIAPKEDQNQQNGNEINAKNEEQEVKNEDHMTKIEEQLLKIEETSNLDKKSVLEQQNIENNENQTNVLQKSILANMLQSKIEETRFLTSKNTQINAKIAHNPPELKINPFALKDSVKNSPAKNEENYSEEIKNDLETAKKSPPSGKSVRFDLDSLQIFQYPKNEDTSSKTEETVNKTTEDTPRILRNSSLKRKRNKTCASSNKKMKTSDSVANFNISLNFEENKEENTSKNNILGTFESVCTRQKQRTENVVQSIEFLKTTWPKEENSSKPRKKRSSTANDMTPKRSSPRSKRQTDFFRPENFRNGNLEKFEGLFEKSPIKKE